MAGMEINRKVSARVKIVAQHIYWSWLGAPARAIRGTAVRPPTDGAYWDAQVSGFFAPRLGGTLQIDTRNEIIAMLIRHKSAPVRSVLDIGCAAATLAPVLFAHGVERYLGVDISNHSIEAARTAVKDPRAEFRQGTVEGFTSEERFDLIVLSEVLYYIDFQTIDVAIRKHARHLTPSGLMCISLYLHPKSRAIQRKLVRLGEYVAGFVYQEKVSMDTHTRYISQERPPFHTFLFKPTRSE